MEKQLEQYTEEQLVYYLGQTVDPAVKRYYQLGLEKHEPILKDNPDRYVLFPIQNHDIWSYYQRALASFWTSADVSLAEDVLQWKSDVIDDGTRSFVKQILGFFSQFDLIINQNLAANFMTEVQVVEAQFFYGFQIAIENIHSQQYSELIDTYIELPTEKDHLFRSIETMPCVREMAQWAFKWMNRDRPFCERLIAFACVEAIMFSGPFAAIYWLKQSGLLPGLSMANELISRDEGLHAEFACLLNSLLKYPASPDVIIEIVKEATSLEINFINESIPCRLIGMNSDLMSQYIKFVADRLLVQLGVYKIYNVSNPFSFMDLISVDNKTNFFERRVSDYSKSGFTAEGQVKRQVTKLLDNF